MIEISYGTYFDNSWKCINSTKTEKEAVKFINNYIDLNNLPHSSYWRMWKEENDNKVTIIDFGSHTYFFKMKEC